MVGCHAEKNKPEPDPDRKKTNEPAREQQPVTPGPKKIGEKPDNLRKREQWFRKRSG